MEMRGVLSAMTKGEREQGQGGGTCSLGPVPSTRMGTLSDATPSFLLLFDSSKF